MEKSLIHTLFLIALYISIPFILPKLLFAESQNILPDPSSIIVQIKREEAGLKVIVTRPDDTQTIKEMSSCPKETTSAPASTAFPVPGQHAPVKTILEPESGTTYHISTEEPEKGSGPLAKAPLIQPREEEIIPEIDSAEDTPLETSKRRIEQRYPGLDRRIEAFQNLPQKFRDTPQAREDYAYHQRLKKIRDSIPSDPQAAGIQIREHNLSEIARLKRELTSLNDEIRILEKRLIAAYENIMRLDQEKRKVMPPPNLPIMVRPGSTVERHLLEYEEARKEYDHVFNELYPSSRKRRAELTYQIRRASEQRDQGEIYLRP